MNETTNEAPNGPLELRQGTGESAYHLLGRPLLNGDRIEVTTNGVRSLGAFQWSGPAGKRPRLVGGLTEDPPEAHDFSIAREASCRRVPVAVRAAALPGERPANPSRPDEGPPPGYDEMPSEWSDYPEPVVRNPPSEAPTPPPAPPERSNRS